MKPKAGLRSEFTSLSLSSVLPQKRPLLYCKRLKLHRDDYLEAYFADLEVIDLKMAPAVRKTEDQLDIDAQETMVAIGNIALHNSDYVVHRKRKTKGADYMLFSADAIRHISNDSAGVEKFTWLGERLKMTFKMLRSDSRLMRTMLHSHGFMQCSSKNQTVNMIWSGALMKNIKMRELMPWQRLNQFPRSTELTKKDRLYENIERAKSIFGDAFDFIPEFYVTPRENVKMRAAFDRLSKECAETGKEFCFPGEFIVKPTNSRQGKGIFFANSMDDIPAEGPLLVSRYLSDPYLVNKHKFDLRIYVAVTSFYPLVAYVYSEGLARLASMPYDTSSSSDSNEFVHLTNYSINKNSTSFVRNESMTSEDLGHKWTLGALLRFVENEGKDAKLLMLRIEDLIVKSLLSIQNSVATASKTCLRFVGTNFELFGFDVLVDKDLKPWLLEVNLSPSLACDAPLDSLIKTRLISDLLNLACIPMLERKIINSVGTALRDSQMEAFDDDDSDDSVEMDPQSVKTLKKRPVGIRRSMMNKSLGSGSSTIVTPSQQKMDQIVRRANTENERRGDFIRVFPRVGTWNMYSGIMEDLGNEDYDQKLYEDVILAKNKAVREGSVEKKMKHSASTSEIYAIPDAEDVEELAELFHNVMMQSSRYPTIESVPGEIRDILMPWYAEASGYTNKITVEGEKYASKLPTIRPSARLRTKSCAEFYENKRAQVLRKREAEAQLLSSQSGSRSPPEKENKAPTPLKK